jgi:hypothetical protein
MDALCLGSDFGPHVAHARTVATVGRRIALIRRREPANERPSPGRGPASRRHYLRPGVPAGGGRVGDVRALRLPPDRDTRLPSGVRAGILPPARSPRAGRATCRADAHVARRIAPSGSCATAAPASQREPSLVQCRACRMRFRARPACPWCARFAGPRHRHAAGLAPVANDEGRPYGRSCTLGPPHHVEAARRLARGRRVCRHLRSPAVASSQ